MSVLGLSDDEQDLQARAADISRTIVRPRAAEIDRTGAYPWDIVDVLKSNGFMGMTIPRAYGGQGRSWLDTVLVIEAMARSCTVTARIVVEANMGAISTVMAYGTEDQKRRAAALVLAGDKPAICITEPDAGSNSHRVATVATRRGDGWSLSGTKYYISGIDEADHVLVVTSTGTDPLTGRGQLTLFVVPTNAPGLSFTPISVGIVATEKQFTVTFDDVALSDDHRIGPEGGALRPLFMGLNPERIISAATLIGLGRYALAKAADYAKTREVWGVPIGSHQGLSHPLAKAAIDVELAALMTAKAAWQFDEGLDPAEASNMAKLAAADAALVAIDQAMQTHGGNGMATDYGLITVWGMARLLKVAPVSREMVLNYIATHTLGLPRSY